MAESFQTFIIADIYKFPSHFTIMDYLFFVHLFYFHYVLSIDEFLTSVLYLNVLYK